MNESVGAYVRRFYDTRYVGNGKTRTMNVYKNGLIFLTFLGSCLCIGLLAASLGTRYWIVSNARIENRPESDGKIFFGLFCGVKNLNYGIGLRTKPIDVDDEMRSLNAYSLWLGTVVCMCGGIIFAAASAVLAVINSATSPITTLTGIPGLYLVNTLSVIFQFGAVALWTIVYFNKLVYNVIGTGDGKEWTTEGMATFGLSYWLVIVSIMVQLLNIALIYSATSEIREKKKAAKPAIEEKTNGAIMLY